MNLRAYYDAYWQEKGDLVDHARLQMLVEKVVPDDKVLLVDCGNGVLGQKLIKAGHTVYATDLSGAAARLARQKGLRVVQIDLDETGLPFPDDAFDVVISDSGLEHRFRVDPVLDECARVLHPGGQFLLLSPNIAHWRVRLWLLQGKFPVVRNSPTDFTHLRFFTLGETVAKLRQRRLEPVQFDGSASLWAWQMYPFYLRWPVVHTVYNWLARRWPGFWARDFIIDARKAG